MMLSRRAFLPNVLLSVAAASVLVLPLSGCGNPPPTVKVDEVVELTENTLTDTLLGPSGPRSETSTVPRDPPLLRKGVYEKVLIAADEKGFVQLSRGSLRENNIKEIEERVTRTVSKRLEKQGFSAQRIDFPPAPQTAPKILIATLVPTTQDAGSEQDRARGKGRQLILVRLTITDPLTGTVLAARDYYSGTDVPINKRHSDNRENGGDRFRR